MVRGQRNSWRDWRYLTWKRFKSHMFKYLKGSHRLGINLHHLTPEDKIITALSDALDFLNDDTYSALVRIAVFHYLFVYIHPFYDGNGRTARFISSVYIAKHLHPLIALRLAVTIKHRKGKYYSLLKDTGAEINCGDLTPFICGFLEFVADTIFDVTRKLKRKISQLERFRRLLSKVIPGNV